MAFFILILTSPLILIPNSKKIEAEEYILLKLLGIWLLCQIYITLNNSFRLPLGIICAILVVYKTKTNKKTKFSAIIIGIISLLLSSAIYLIFKS
jgi:hypothetical protein